MNGESFFKSLPFLLVLSSLLFNQRYYRHGLALLAAFIALASLPNLSIFLEIYNQLSFFQHPVETFWVGMLAINIAFLVHAGWLKFLPLSAQELEIYNKYFRKFTRSNFKKLMDLGKLENKANGALLVKQGERMEFVLCIFDGSAGVSIDGEKIASLKNGDFIGEMSFLSGNLSSATVRCEVLTTMLIWKQEDLKGVLRKNPSLLVEFNRTIESQISRKLINKETQVN